MKKQIHWYDYITVNSYWFAIAVRSQVMTPLLIPLLVQQFVGEDLKGTYYGNLRLWGLMAALLFQAVMGVLSDHYQGRRGRRRIFITIGTAGEVATLAGIGTLLGGHSLESFWILFSLYIVSMAFSNTAQAGVNGFIPDLIPDSHKSKFSTVKALFDLPLSLIFFSFVLTRVISSGNIPAVLIILAVVNGICLLLSLMVHEEAPLNPSKIEWQPLIRIVGMVLAFTIIILASGSFIGRLTALISALHWSGRDFWIVLTVTGGIGLAILGSVMAGLHIGLGAEATRNQEYTRWVVNRLAFLTGVGNLGGFMAYFLQSRFAEMQGIQAAQAVSGLIIATGVCILLSTLPSGWLCDRFGKKHVIVVSSLLVMAGVFVLINVGRLEIMTIGAGMIGCGAGLFYTASWALGTTIVPQGMAGLYLGISNIASAGAGAIGAYIGGPIGDKYGYGVLMLVYGLITLLSSLAFVEFNLLPWPRFTRVPVRFDDVD